MRRWEVGIKYLRNYTVTVPVVADGPKEAFILGYDLLLKEGRSNIVSRLKQLLLMNRQGRMLPMYYVKEVIL